MLRTKMVRRSIDRVRPSLFLLRFSVVKTNVFLKDMKDFAAMNEVYSEGKTTARLACLRSLLVDFLSVHLSSSGPFDRSSCRSSSSEFHLSSFDRRFAVLLCSGRESGNRSGGRSRRHRRRRVDARFSSSTEKIRN